MTDLTDRMRTCAAAIVAGAPDQPFMEWQLVYRDAADLLIAAATEIELLTGPIDLGEPMAVIPAAARQMPELPGAAWVAAGDTLPVANPYRGRHTCPKCDSRAGKTVRRVENKLMIKCPVCSETWEYKR